MEVILKKSKITKSILDQSQQATIIDFKQGVILGWVQIGPLKYMIIHRENLISKYPIFKEAVKETFTQNSQIVVGVILGGSYIPKTYNCATEEEATKFIEILNLAKNLALSKGQFYI